MRVIAGEFRGRRLQPLRLDLRPTSDKLRETLFDVIAAAQPIAGTRWLDLYAGSGAVGIEALSRGASFVCFIDVSREAIELAQRNLEALQAQDRARLICASAAQGLKKLARTEKNFGVCFFDPPYKMEAEYESVLLQLSAPGVLAADALVVAEHSKRFDPPEHAGALERFRKLQQGDAALSFYRRVKVPLNT